jgi:hypothetical protein
MGLAWYMCGTPLGPLGSVSRGAKRRVVHHGPVITLYVMWFESSLS